MRLPITRLQHCHLYLRRLLSHSASYGVLLFQLPELAKLMKILHVNAKSAHQKRTIYISYIRNVPKKEPHEPNRTEPGIPPAPWACAGCQRGFYVAVTTHTNTHTHTHTKSNNNRNRRTLTPPYFPFPLLILYARSQSSFLALSLSLSLALSAVWRDVSWTDVHLGILRNNVFKPN